MSTTPITPDPSQQPITAQDPRVAQILAMIRDKSNAPAPQTTTPTLNQNISAAQPLYSVGQPQGLISSGNINVNDRPIIPTPYEGGNPSTVYSTSIGIDGGKTALIPRVSDGADGQPRRVMSPQESIDYTRAYYYNNSRTVYGIILWYSILDL